MSSHAMNPGVVVGVDGSSSSKRAVQWAAHEARMRNVPLTLVHVVVTPSWGPAPWLLSNPPYRFPPRKTQHWKNQAGRSSRMRSRSPKTVLTMMAVLKSTVSCSFRCPCPHLSTCLKRRKW